MRCIKTTNKEQFVKSLAQKSLFETLLYNKGTVTGLLIYTCPSNTYMSFERYELSK